MGCYIASDRSQLSLSWRIIEVFNGCMRVWPDMRLGCLYMRMYSVDLQCTLCVCCHGNGHMVGGAHSVYHQIPVFLCWFSRTQILLQRGKEGWRGVWVRDYVDLGSTVWTAFRSKILACLIFLPGAWININDNPNFTYLIKGYLQKAC